MSIQTKIINLNRYSYDSQIVSKTNMWWEYAKAWQLSLHFQFDDGNETYTMAGGYGDACMTDGSIQHDGDLIVSCGHGDGYAVRRLNDDGTMTYIAGTNIPDGVYTAYHSHAIDKVRHISYIANHVYDKITKCDYSDIVTGGSTITYVNLTEAGNDLPSDEVGYTYTCGLALAGDYLYIMPDDKTSNQAMRWNTQTETNESLAMVGNTVAGRYGRAFYDEPNDRIYGLYRSTIGIYVVENASKSATDPTNPAVAYYINLSGAIGTNTAYSSGVYVTDNPNEIFIMGYYGRIAKIDITPCVTGVSTTPTLLYRNANYYGVSGKTAPYGGTYTSAVKHPENPELWMVSAGGSWNPWLGWIDMENCIIVSFTYYNTETWDGVNLHRYPMYSNDMLMYDYAPSPIVATSANATKYMVHSGYADDGYKFRTWTLDKYKLHESGDVVFGTFSLDDNSNIAGFRLDKMAERTYVPTGTSFTVEISNDNGITWELYDYASEQVHTFNSSGTQCRMKISITGNGYKCAYVVGDTIPTITLLGDSALYADENPLRNRTKINSV